MKLLARMGVRGPEPFHNRVCLDTMGLSGSPAPSRRLLCHTLLDRLRPPTPLACLGLRRDYDRSSVILLSHQQCPDGARYFVGERDPDQHARLSGEHAFKP